MMKEKDPELDATPRGEAPGPAPDTTTNPGPAPESRPPGNRKRRRRDEGPAPAAAAGRPAPRTPTPNPGGKQVAPATRSLRGIIAQGAVTPVTRSLPEVKLGADPVRIMMFSDEAETVFLHYEGDESVRSYFHCAGAEAGCPYCRLGKKREEYLLTPVYAIANREVSVLRILAKEGPNRLLSLLSPYLSDEDIDQKGVAISRIGYRYVVQSFPVRPGADVGAAAVAAFLDSYKAGQLKLASTFPAFSVEELSDVPAIRNELDVLDGPAGGPPSPASPLKGKRGRRSPASA